MSRFIYLGERRLSGLPRGGQRDRFIFGALARTGVNHYSNEKKWGPA